MLVFKNMMKLPERSECPKEHIAAPQVSIAKISGERLLL